MIHFDIRNLLKAFVTLDSSFFRAFVSSIESVEHEKYIKDLKLCWAIAFVLSEKVCLETDWDRLFASHQADCERQPKSGPEHDRPVTLQ